MKWVITTRSPDDTETLAERLAAEALRGGETLLLNGDLGAGKTCFVRGLARGLGVEERRVKSPTYNTMQICQKSQCPFDTDPSSGTENLEIPQYRHAVVMGVNEQRVPGNGGAFFLHSTDGGPTAGCVSIDDQTLVGIIKWLRPGALIAVSK